MELLTLRDGTEALILPLVPTDREKVAEAYAELSPDSRRKRFLTVVDHLTPTMLDTLVDAVDGVDHVALVLFAETAADVFDPIALGRIVRYDDHREAADVAVTVRDEWQGRGAAAHLMTELVRQRPPGVTHLVTDVLAENPASLAMLRKVGQVQVDREGSGILEVCVDLIGAEPTFPEALQQARSTRKRLPFPWGWCRPPGDDDPRERVRAS